MSTVGPATAARPRTEPDRALSARAAAESEHTAAALLRRQARTDRARDTEEERDLALAATWHLDPSVLRPKPTDSAATSLAREQLAAINDRLGAVVDRYEKAWAAAVSAEEAAELARAHLAMARADLREATEQYNADRAMMVSLLTSSYSMSEVGSMSLMLTADSEEDLLNGLTLLEEVGRSQTDAVEAARRSSELQRRATLEVAAAEAAARERLSEAQRVLAEAEEARRAVIADVRAARRIVKESELADRARRDAFASGYDGAVVFPLPPDASYVDQDNFGRRSSHWATTHTGDDLSTGCGTPVLAATDGTVLVRTDQGWSGPWLVMVVADGSTLTTWYAHMQALDVVNGQHVHAGNRIGLVGQAGNATGCHLHFEVHPAGGSIYEDDTDPAEWLRAVGAYPGDA